jgi:hypothetical protein
MINFMEKKHSLVYDCKLLPFLLDLMEIMKFIIKLTINNTSNNIGFTSFHISLITKKLIIEPNIELNHNFI